MPRSQSPSPFNLFNSLGLRNRQKKKRSVQFNDLFPIVRLSAGSLVVGADIAAADKFARSAIDLTVNWYLTLNIIISLW